jgi:diaminopimelate decarboxylase
MIVREFAGVPIASIARDFGTPTYVYDQAVIERRIDDLAGFPVVRYAQKACSNVAILDLMRRKGVLVDATTAGEVHRALTAGYRPEEVVYTSDAFDRTALELAAKLPVGVNCGSSDMIRQIAAVSPGRRLTLRINPGFGHGHSQKTNTGGEGSKHGIWHEQLPDCLALAKQLGVVVHGLHVHIGSGSDFEHLAQVRHAMERLAALVGRDLEVISAGGGLPTPYRPEDQPLDVARFTSMWLETRDRIQERLGRPVQLEVEPGRYLVAESGGLVCEIRAVKVQGSKTYYIVDAGFNNLARPVLYGAYHPISICPSDGRPVSQTQPVVVAGPLCESGDVFTQSEGGFVETRELPVARVGDFLTIHCAGAYGFSMSSNYNSTPTAAEVLVREGEAVLIRERQPIEDLVRLERLPSRATGDA